MPATTKPVVSPDHTAELLRELCAISTYPLDPAHEDRMEELSFEAGGGGEQWRHWWAPGRYACARCDRTLYSSDDKWDGPCIWPSFRRGAVDEDDDDSGGGGDNDEAAAHNAKDTPCNGGSGKESSSSLAEVAAPVAAAPPPPPLPASSRQLSLLTRHVLSYNKYTCRVFEVYCGGCQLFLGHKFEDGAAKGDKHPQARWRH
jgi:peptide methionine sulfoxide reductase MsrB